MTLAIDRIAYDVTIQISALQHGVCARVRACVHYVDLIFQSLPDCGGFPMK